jgi:hydroxymethylglutaryl-CoA reductase (NADPH)
MSTIASASSAPYNPKPTHQSNHHNAPDVPVLPFLQRQLPIDDHDAFAGNIENYLGLTQIPTGLTGPLRITGPELDDTVRVPLATTEGALVASFSRGAKACTLAGGVYAAVLAEGVQRSPLFVFRSMAEAARCLEWTVRQQRLFPALIRRVSMHARFENLRTYLEGNQLILCLEFTTGDAAGQNMATFCAQAVAEFIVGHGPVRPERWYLESNFSGDKKITTASYTGVRGRKVSAEVTVPAAIVERVLRSTPAAIEGYYRSMVSAAVQSGAVGINGHYANGLAALFLACGQDVACVAEAAVGFTRFECTSAGDLYAAVTLPSMIVGTVGGGTALPTQAECLDLLACRGAGRARRFAAIAAATVLCGELSIAAALAEGHFAQAHRRLGRQPEGALAFAPRRTAYGPPGTPATE